MANLFGRLVSYFNSWGNAKFEEKADPKIQIQQAIEHEQKQHLALAQQASTVIGQQHQLEMKLNRQLKQVDELNDNIRQALVLSDQATANGDTAKAQQYNTAAEAFAQQLTTAEATVTDLKNLYLQAKQAAEQAKTAVNQSATQLQNTLNERTHLLNQLEQAKMQEEVSKSMSQVHGMLNASNSPNFSDIRNKIESRYAQSTAQVELAQNSVEGQLADIKISTAQLQAKKKLDEIRNQLKLESQPEGSSYHSDARLSLPTEGES